MQRYHKNLLFIFLTALFLNFSSTAYNSLNAQEEEHQEDLLRGNVVCLIVDKEKKSIFPKIGTTPCNNEPSHPHGFVDKSIPEGKFYYIQGSPEAIEELEKTSDREDVELKGIVSRDENAPVIFIK